MEGAGAGACGRDDDERRRAHNGYGKGYVAGEEKMLSHSRRGSEKALSGACGRDEDEASVQLGGAVGSDHMLLGA